MDPLGLIAFALMMLFFLMLLDFGARADGFENPLLILLAAGFLLSGVVFLLVEAYWAASPLIPLKMLKNPSVGIQYLVQMLCMIAIFAVGGFSLFEDM